MTISRSGALAVAGTRQAGTSIRDDGPGSHGGIAALHVRNSHGNDSLSGEGSMRRLKRETKPVSTNNQTERSSRLDPSNDRRNNDGTNE